MKKLDPLDKLRTFDDTMTYVEKLKTLGHMNEAKHMHLLWKVAKELGTEVRRTRGNVKCCNHRCNEGRDCPLRNQNETN